MNDSKFIIQDNDLQLQSLIRNGTNYDTYSAALLTDLTQCAAKILHNDAQEDFEQRFLKYIDKIKDLVHPGLIPFIGFCLKGAPNAQNALIYKFAAHFSLQHVFDKRKNSETPIWWDQVRQFIIIYGIAQTMSFLHENKMAHERLKPSNILINHDLEPQITDFNLSTIYPAQDLSAIALIENNLVNYADPAILNCNGVFNEKSDVYAFSIIVIQILSGNEAIFENDNDPEKLIKDIKNGLLPIIPSSFPDELRNLLNSCLNREPKLRPSFRLICKKLNSIIESLPDINTDIFKEYRDKLINNSRNNEMSSEIQQLKEMADNGDSNAMYLYAKARLEGHNCKKNITEATRYFQMAKKNGNQAAIKQLALLRHDSGSIATPFSEEALDTGQTTQQQSQDAEQEPENQSSSKDDIILLANDPYFDKPKCEFQSLINDIDNAIANENPIHFNKKEIEEQNFIFTEGAENRLLKLYNYIKVGVPVLLEGPTGTSKTLSSEIVCKLLGAELVRFNLSSETKTQDLLGRYVGDDSSWAGIKQQNGPFFKAFQQGKVLLLDEINLASSSVLQCIEEALDSGVLSIEIPGRPLQKIYMHPKFRVIATQNPNKGSYAHKRQSLGLKFYSRFQAINFPALTDKELSLIGEGLAIRFGYKNLELVRDLVKFHKEWSENPIILDDPQCFTIREIAAAVKAFSLGESVYDTIMTIYGARYQNDIKQKLKMVLSKYPRLTNDSKDFQCPNFPGCFLNESLKIAIKSTLFSLKNGRHVILTGREGCGKTQAAIWISEYYNNLVQPNSSQDESFFCICSEEIKVADLVGHQAPSGKSDGTSELIKWQDGFLTKAVIQGMCCVLESLDEAPATVLERLNGLLDQKYDKNDRYFDIPENSANPQVKIKEQFRIIATSNIEKLSQMSPAVLNRFDIIVLENQIDDDITQDQFKQLISTLLDRYCSDITSMTKNAQNNNNETVNNDILDDGFFEFEDNLNCETKPNAQENIQSSTSDQQEEQISYTYPKDLIPLIYEKIKHEKYISKISKMCNAIVKLSYALQNSTKIDEASIVDFVFLLLKSNKQFTVPAPIEESLLDMLQVTFDNTDDPFFYKDSPILCNFLAKLTAYSIIGQPVCVIGPTGAGKTSAARAFARMRPRKSNVRLAFQMHSFHSGTKVSHFFGSTTLLDGKIVFHDGTLTTALKSGLVFIADEFNLSTQSVMKSLSLALDKTIGKNVFIPGIGQMINISPEFHFIACQNELGTLGRNAIPDSISHRFVYLDYPKPDTIDIQKICINISKENFPKDKPFKDEDQELAQNIANYMIKLNSISSMYLPQWSLRDITKLFRRIYPQYPKKILNIKPIHHVLFSTMSAVAPKDYEKIIQEVGLILKQSFNLSDAETKEYIDCFLSQPVRQEVENQGFYMMKNNLGIPINRINKFIVDKQLPSLWNAIFQVYLSDSREPILIMGNSGFKTFLAQQFLPKARIVTLNQETNVAQLLGSSGFMTISEAKLFYIDYLCKIIQSDSPNLFNQLRDLWENGNLSEDILNPKIIEGKRGSISTSFYYALDHLKDKLLEDQERSKDCILSNTTLEFQPGLFLNAILQGQSLILKDLSNLPTIVLERFNELFSGKQNITLSEDIHNTFTPPESKELTDFSDSFRVFATCPSNSPTKLSEAVLSRFTVISVSDYSSEEQEVVLKSYIQINKLMFDPADINILHQFAAMYLKNMKLTFTFPQMIKVVEITSKMNQKTSLDFQKLNLGITLYRVLGGLLDSDNRKEELFGNIKTFFDIPDIYRTLSDDKCQLSITKRSNESGVLSNISNLFLKCSTAQVIDTNVAFTGSFNDLLDLIHMSLTIHNPLLLEGPPGQGKHTAIKYITEMLNMETVYIMISSTTKVEDLFGKETITRRQDGIHVEMVETQFITIIKSTNSANKRSLIVLENINNASPALLNALVPVFNTYSSSILLPNGSTIEKGSFDIIGIFNTQQISSSKDKLPSSLINSSIYHIVSRSTKKEILNIILTRFTSAGLSTEEAIRFNTMYMLAKQVVADEGLSSDLFTINDIDKYILFRNLTQNEFKESTIAQMIFAYRFSSNDLFRKINTTLNFETMNFSPLIDFSLPPTQLIIKLSNDQTNALIVPLHRVHQNPSVISQIQSLTLPQKHCLIFLACSVLSKRACVIQGDTASGKSYLIRLFSELIGVKLNVFQMNSDSNISMLAGQSVLNDSLSRKDIRTIKKAFADLSIDDDIRQYLDDPKNINTKDENKWTPKILKKFLGFIQNLDNRDKSYYQEIEKSVQIIKDTMNPVNRFEHQKSTFLNAMKNGEWVLIDGIESAPSVIAEKISSLCGANPELNLYEYGREFYFSKDPGLPLENQIHDNFRLFITYNPHSMKESQMIDQSFFVKSVTFTLPSIDAEPIYSAQMLLGSLLNTSYPLEFSKELATRFATLHQYAKSESQKSPDDFAGDLQYNGRTLKFITKAFAVNHNSSNDNVLEQISFSTKSFYLNSYINQEKAKSFQSNCIRQLKEPPAIELRNSLVTRDSNLRERNEKVLLDLRSIQNILLKKNTDCTFSFATFLQSCKLMQISDVSYVQKHIQMTIDLIKSHSDIKYLGNTPLTQYGALYSIRTIFESIIHPACPIIKEHTFLQLDKEALRTDKSIEMPMLTFDLLSHLLEKQCFSEDSSILLDNEIHSDILSQIYTIVSTQKKESFKMLFETIEKDNNLIKIIHKMFPYLKFKETSFSMISYWMPLAQKLIENRIRFSYTIDGTKYSFNDDADRSFSFDLIMNEKDSFSLSKDSTIYFNNNASVLKVKAHEQKENQENDLVYFSLISGMAEYPTKQYDRAVMNVLMRNARNDYYSNKIVSPSSNSILLMKDLFYSKDSVIIKCMWNLIFTLSEKQIFELSQILHPIDSMVLISAYNMLKSINSSVLPGIISWNSWASDIGTNITILNDIITGREFDYKLNAQDMIASINDEIKYFQRYPKQMSPFWSSEDLIKLYQAPLSHFQKSMQDIDDFNKEIAIQKKIKELQNELINHKVKKNFENMKSELINILRFIDHFTDENLLLIEKKVRQFIHDANLDYTDNKDFIAWPHITIKGSASKYSKTENIRLFEALIWYSQIKHILSDINEGRNMINRLSQLNDFPEMAYSREALFEDLYNNSNVDKSGLTQKVKQDAFHTLNANMILKLYSVNLFFLKEPNRIAKVFNNYMNREAYDERELAWIYNAIPNLAPNLILPLPEFEPNDLVYLIVNKKSRSDYQPGPLFTGIQDSVFLRNMKPLMHREFYSFSKAAYSIGKVVYETLLFPNQKAPEQYDTLKNAFTNLDTMKPNIYSIVHRIKQIFEIADYLSQWSNNEILFDDISFLSQNWMENFALLNQFPSLIFWICKNKQCADQLIQKYQQHQVLPNTMPLWLLTLRIMSSMECITFDSTYNSRISTIINEVTSTLIKEYLRNSKKYNNPINFDWISILLSSVPIQISNPYNKIIHDFFAQLCKDDQAHQSNDINQMKNFYIKNSIAEITKLMISNQSQQLLTDSIFNPQAATQFLAFPSQFVQQKINDSLSGIKRSILSDQRTTELHDFLSQTDKLPTIIDHLKIAINEEQKEMDDFYQKKIKSEIEQRKTRKLNDIKKSIERYNAIIFSLLHHEIGHREIEHAISELIGYQKRLELYPTLFKNEGIHIKKIQYQSNTKIPVEIRRKDIFEPVHLAFPNTNNRPRCHYLFPDEDYKQEDNVFLHRPCSIEIVDNIWFKYIHEQFDLASIVELDITSAPQGPVLVFGHKSQLAADFIHSLELLNTTLQLFDSNFFNVFTQNRPITSENFAFIQRVNNMINDCMKNLQVRFSNNSNAPITLAVLQGDLREFLDNLSPLINNLIHLMQTSLYPIWKALFENKRFIKLFKYKYDIIIPKMESKPNSIPNFSVINKINSLASPILCLSPDNKIICSVNMLKCYIGPIFPTLIYQPYSINILSFIKSEVTYKIEGLTDPQFSKIISIKDKLKNSEPLQIFIAPPHAINKEPSILTLKGNILIKTENLEPFVLPFEFILSIIPMTIRVQSLEYKLAEEEKGFRLCCDKIDSSSILNFEILNYYVHDSFIVAVELESLEENEGEKPEITIDKIHKTFSLRIPKVSNPTRSKFNIKIAFSQTFVCIIHCDFVIMPLVFSFEVYDYYTKQFSSTSCTLFGIKDFNQKLRFRIQTIFPCEKKGAITFKLPQWATINQSLAQKTFRIKENTIIDYTLQVTYNPSFNLNDYYKAVLEIENQKETIQIKFVSQYYLRYDPFGTITSNDFMSTFPCYFYEFGSKKWKKIVNSVHLLEIKHSDEPIFIVSPFNHYISTDLHEIDYSKDIISISKTSDLLFLQLTIPTNCNPIFNLKRKDPSKTKHSRYLFNYDNVYYSILGFNKDHPNKWFPVFDAYPNRRDVQPLLYTEELENINLANENITKMFSTVGIQTPKTISDCFTTNYELHVSQTNFAILMALLIEKDIVLNIKQIVQQMPDEIQIELVNIIEEIDPLLTESLSNELCTVISHNLIIVFATIFEKKYNQIKSNRFYLELTLDESEIQHQILNAYNEYFTYAPIRDTIKSAYMEQQFNKIEAILRSITVMPLPEESLQHECYIVCENSNPRECKPFDELGSLQVDDLANIETTISNNIDSFTFLPDIKLPSENSIQSLNSFYSICSQGATILPTYIRCQKIKNSDLKTSELYFSSLLTIYNEITKETTLDMSILARNVNLFTESFKNCVKRLKKAGVDFTNICIPQSCNDTSTTYNQDFISQPPIEYPYVAYTPWKTKYQYSANFMKFTDPSIKPSKMTIIDSRNPIRIDDSLDSLFKPIHSNTNSSQQPEVKQTMQQLSNEKKKLIMAQVIHDGGNTNDETKDFDDSKDINIPKDSEEQKTPVLRVHNDAKTIQINSDEAHELNADVSELDSIERVVSRIIDMNKKDNLKFSNSSSGQIQNEELLFMATSKIYPVKELIDNSQFLIANLISKVSDSNCPLLHIYANLIFDISCFIPIENKLYNFMLLIAFSYALSASEIPFSIAIAADENFRFVLKPFDEEISVFVLQRILDCIFIVRYRTNIADTVYHSLESMKCTYQNRTQRAMFVFSNGIDDTLVLGESWKNYLLSNSNNSFGFIFVKSKILEDKKYEVVQKMWDDFNEIAKTAPSITKLIAITPDISSNTFDLIFNSFATVLSRSSKQQFNDNFEAKADEFPEFKQKYGNLTGDVYERIKEDMEYSFDGVSKSFFRKADQRYNAVGTRFPKLDISFYRNKTAKITTSVPESAIKDDFDHFIHKILHMRRNAFRPLLETIFKPNKASQTVLSSTGTDFDITALILNLINPVPDPLIYLEEKGGLIRNYGISIIIDSSKSCFSQISSSHSFQTIKTLLSALASIDIPYIDIIIATKTNPIVLCSETQSIRLLSDKSPFWPSLFTCISQSISDYCNLESAIHASYDIRRMRSTDAASFLFVLTDGLFQREQKDLISKHIMACIQSGMLVFGIGLGIYPSGIVDIFPQAIFATNPNYLINGIASLFGDDSTESYSDSIKYLAPDQTPFRTIAAIFTKLIQNKDHPIFKDLRNYLNDTKHSMDAFSDMYNYERPANRNASNALVNPEGHNTEMYVKDLLKGQKILIFMHYTEGPAQPKNVYKPPAAGQKCIKDAVNFFGIDIVVATTYSDAIRELKKQTVPGKCDYYSLWILSDRSPHSNMNVEFIDCAIKFWRNGGSVVLWADNDPFTYEANLFLERVVFPDGTRTNLRVHGNNPGAQHLSPDPSGNLDKPQTFNKSPIQFKQFNRSSLAHNLYDIFEGITLAFANSSYAPFTPFSRDSSGGISSLYYTGDRDPSNRTGDIIVDCGWTKLFWNMEESGTFRYLQNIAGWTAQCEFNRVNGVHPKNYRPKAVQ